MPVAIDIARPDDELARAPLTVTVGGTALEFSGALGSGGDSDDLYAPFCNGRTEHALSTLAVNLLPTLVPPLSDPNSVFDTGSSWSMARSGNRLSMEMRGNKGVLWRVVTDDDFSHVTAGLGADPQTRDGDGRWLPSMVRYPFDQLLYVHHGLTRGALLIHAAGFVVNGVGVVLAGVSGAGKSTVSHALADVEDVIGLSDDRVVVRSVNGEFRLFGTPWSGDARVADGADVPLRAVCLLTQSTNTTHASRLPPAAALPGLLRVCSIAWYDRTWTDAALATCESLLETVPAFELHFEHDGALLPSVLTRLVEGISP